MKTLIGIITLLSIYSVYNRLPTDWDSDTKIAATMLVLILMLIIFAYICMSIADWSRNCYLERKLKEEGHWIDR